MSADVVVIGSGMGSLSAAALLARKGYKILLLEQNWIPGGCTTSYWRKGFVFEAGATTVVGMDQGMPLQYVLDATGIKIPMRKLKIPMQVHLPDGRLITRHQNIENWIVEAKKNFSGDQEGFWRKAFEISQFVWQVSTRYRQFPPSNGSDWMSLLKNAQIKHVLPARYALRSTAEMMKKYSVWNEDFRAFVDEQLMITAQNTSEEVNFLFGATALCYTNYQNFYIDGGLFNLVNPFVNYIQQQGGEIVYKNKVTQIKKSKAGFEINGSAGTYFAKKIIAGIPLNNLLEIYPDLANQGFEKKTLKSEQLNSAFQMGIGFKISKYFEVIHHQIHLEKPLTTLGSKSIFISLSHADDVSRSDHKGMSVASISTHLPNPAATFVDSALVENEILDVLEQRGFLQRADIQYLHSSGPKSWMKWTQRKWGFVGGYPQFMKIRPWQMQDARLEEGGLYLAGDTAYPGQGIPGACLSGIISAEKLMSDG